MYIVVVSWDIATVEPAWSQIDKQMRQCLESFRHVKPVNTFYIVEVYSEQQRTEIFDGFSAVKKYNSVQVLFVVSPLFGKEGAWLGTVANDELAQKVTEIIS